MNFPPSIKLLMQPFVICHLQSSVLGFRVVYYIFVCRILSRLKPNLKLKIPPRIPQIRIH